MKTTNAIYINKGFNESTNTISKFIKITNIISKKNRQNYILPAMDILVIPHRKFHGTNSPHDRLFFIIYSPVRYKYKIKNNCILSILINTNTHHVLVFFFQQKHLI